MKIFLLTHERELLRTSNTGVLAQNVAPEIVERIIWGRNTPNPSLLDAINPKNTVLLYPIADAEAARIEFIYSQAFEKYAILRGILVRVFEGVDNREVADFVGVLHIL